EQVDLGVLELERRADEEEGPELAGVPDDALSRRRAEQREKDVLVVRIAEETVGERLLRAAVLLLHAAKDRRLLQLQADVDREDEQDDGQDERDAPAPGREGVLEPDLTAQVDDDEREQEAERRGGLDPARVVAAPVVGRVLGDVGRGAAVLAAEG